MQSAENVVNIVHEPQTYVNWEIGPEKKFQAKPY